MTPDQMIAAARARRSPACTDETGATWRTPEKRAFMDALRAWKAKGSPASEVAALKARERELRRADLF